MPFPFTFKFASKLREIFAPDEYPVVFKYIYK